jgi:hypothetical protein
VSRHASCLVRPFAKRRVVQSLALSLAPGRPRQTHRATECEAHAIGELIDPQLGASLVEVE